MDKLVESITQAGKELCKGMLRGKELPEFLAYLVAWEILEGDLPEHLRASSTRKSLSVDVVRRIWPAIADCESLGSTRYAFAESDKFPFQQLSSHALTELAFRVAMTVRILEPADLVELATWIVDVYFDDPKSGEQTFPKEVAKFLFDELKLRSDDQVLCPQPNAEWFAIAAMKAGNRPIVAGARPPIPIGMFSAITGNKFDYIAKDYLSADSRDVGELARGRSLLLAPPFGYATDSFRQLGYMLSQFDARTAEALGLELAIKTNGKSCAVVVSNSFLFKTGAEQRIREHLVESGLLDAVVGFPQGLLSTTNIPFTALLLSGPHSDRSTKICKIDEAKHVDGRGKLRAHRKRFIGERGVATLLKTPDGRRCKYVSVADLRSQDYRLVPEQFLERPSDFFSKRRSECTPLSEVVSVIKPQLLREDKSGEGVAVREVSPGELPQFSYLTHASRERQVERRDFESRRSQVVRTGDILLSTKGTIGKVGIAQVSSDEIPLVPSLSSLILRRKNYSEIVDATYLVVYLRSPAVQQLLNSMAVGAVIRNIPLNALRKLPVWVPPVNEQQRFIEVFEKQASLEQRAAEIARQQEKAERDLWQSVGLGADAG